MFPYGEELREDDPRLPPTEQRFPYARSNSDLITELNKSGDRNKMTILIKNGANVNQKGIGGMTALHHAAFADDPEKIQFLLDNGADKNIRDDNGQTALDIAIRHKKQKSIDVLKIAGGTRRNKSKKSRKSRKSKKSKKSRKSRKFRK